MPATSQAQQRLMAVAEHNPSKVFKRNRGDGVLSMSARQLHDFSATARSGLPKRTQKTNLGQLMRLRFVV